MKFILAAVLAFAFTTMTRTAEASSFSAAPVTLKFMKINPVYVTTFFSFYKAKNGEVVLRITVNTLLSRGSSDQRSADTVFRGANLQLSGGRVYLTRGGRSILIAHGSSFGGWKTDDAKLKFPKKIHYAQNEVVVTPVLNVP